MKNLPTVFLLFLSFSLLGQNSSQQLLEETAEKIGLQKTNVDFDLATYQEFENGILVVLPEIAEEGDGYLIFNSNIVLIDKKSGAVKAKFTGEKDWSVDAVRIDQIYIEPKVYQLQKNTLAYGLKITYSGQSRPNPYSSTQLSLYALEGTNLDRVLRDFPIKTISGETDTTCRGTYEEHSRNLEIVDGNSDQYADLIVIEQIEKIELNEDCKKTIEGTTKKVEILKYENGGYSTCN